MSFKYVPFDVDESLSFDKQWEASAAKLGKNMEMVKKAKKTWDTKFERVRGRPEYPGWQGVGESAGSRQLAHNAVKPSSISAPGSISEPTNIDKTIHMGKQAANAPEGELVDYDKIFQSGDLQEDPKGPKWTYDDQYQESKFDPKPHDT
ncbi:MAG: hypothetical protein ACKVPX_08405 [Myxococcaceae bacterium]